MEEDILNYLYQLSCFVGHPVGGTQDPVCKDGNMPDSLSPQKRQWNYRN